MAGSLNAVDAFIDNLEQSNLLSPERLEVIRTEFRGVDVSQLRQSVESIALRGWLTQWQARMLLSGRAAFFLGKYKLLEHLGEGGMGSVLKAEQLPLGRLVAIKTLRKELVSSPAMIERFHREIRAAAALSHPNIVSAYDADCVAGRHFLVMEYVDGEDLGKVVSGGKRLPIDVACEYIRQAARGLQHAHERGMVHRDIKPSNLLLTQLADGSPSVKILDMGLAVIDAASSGVRDLTITGQVIGTPDYIAPEQARKTKSADVRSDIYSLGCTLYRLLTGHVPFDGETAIEKITARVVENAPSLRTALPDAPQELEAILLKMMARDPSERFQLPHQVVQTLSPFGAVQRVGTEQTQGVSKGPQAAAVLPPDDVEAELDEFLSQLSTQALGFQDPGTVSQSLESTPAAGKRQSSPSMQQPGAEVTPRDVVVTPVAQSNSDLATLSRTGEELHAAMMARNIVDRRRLRIAGTAIALFVAAVVGLLVWQSGRETRLVVEWPIDEREGATIEVDNKLRQLEEGERIELTGLPGQRTLRVTRTGYLDIEESWDLVSGQEIIFRPEWRPTDQTIRRQELATLTQRVADWRDGLKANPSTASPGSPEVSNLCDDLLDFQFRHRTSAETALAGAQLSLLPWPADELQRDEIDVAELQAAQVDEMLGAPAELVAVFRHENLDGWKLQRFNSVAISRDGRDLLSAGGSQGQIKRWHLDSRDPVSLFTGDVGSIRSAAINGSGTLIAGVFQRNISLWQSESEVELRTLSGDSAPLSCVTFSPDGQLVAVGRFDGVVQLWNSRTGQQKHQIRGHQNNVYDIAFHPDGERLASAGADKTVKIWDVKTGKPLRTIEGHPRRVFGIAFSPGGGKLASAGEDGAVRIWDSTSGKQLSILNGHVGKVFSVSFRPDGRSLATAGRDDGTVRTWDLFEKVAIESMKIRLASIGESINTVCYTPDGRHLLTANGNGTLYVLRLEEWSKDPLR